MAIEQNGVTETGYNVDIRKNTRIDTHWTTGNSGYVFDSHGNIIALRDTSYTRGKTGLTRIVGTYEAYSTFYYENGKKIMQQKLLFSRPFYAGDKGPFFPIPTETQKSIAHVNATNRLISKIGKLKQANLGVTLIEAKQTIRLIGDTASRIVDAYKHLRKGRFSKCYSRLMIAKKTVLPKHLIKKYGVKTANSLMRLQRKNWLAAKRRKDTVRLAELAATGWLEIHFGWKPLLQDTYDLAKATAYAQTEKIPEHFVFKASETHVQEASPTTAVSIDSGGSSIVSCTRVWRCTVKNVHSWMNQKFGLNNPASVFYEAVPFSFVLDWFVPVGTLIEGLGVTTGLQFASACDSYKITQNATSIYDLDQMRNGNRYKKYSVTGRGLEQYERAPVQPYIPVPSLPPVNFAALMDPWKLTTAIALGTSLTRVR